MPVNFLSLSTRNSLSTARPSLMASAGDGAASYQSEGARGSLVRGLFGAEPALDCIQKLIAHGYLRGEADPTGGSEAKLLSRLIKSVCKCCDLGDEGVELLALKTILLAVTSIQLRIHGDSLLQIVRTSYDIYLSSKNVVNQTTAKASLIQMLVIVFRRMEADSSTVPVFVDFCRALDYGFQIAAITSRLQHHYWGTRGTKARRFESESESKNGIGVKNKLDIRELAIQFGCVRLSPLVQKGLSLERFLASLHASRRATADCTRPVFTATGFYLCAKKHKLKVDKNKLIELSGTSEDEFSSVSTSMKDLCHDVFGVAKEKKDPKSVKGNRGFPGCFTSCYACGYRKALRTKYNLQGIPDSKTGARLSRIHKVLTSQQKGKESCR